MSEVALSLPTKTELILMCEAHEGKVKLELNEQHRILKQQAQGIFAAIKGRRGANTEEYWQDVFAQAKIDYEAGKFLIERLGADRQLDLPLVATLTQLRQQLLAAIVNPTTADHLLADSAIIAYRNLLRIQGWVGAQPPLSSSVNCLAKSRSKLLMPMVKPSTLKSASTNWNKCSCRSWTVHSV